MIRAALIACLLTTPALAAETKAESCGYQADVVAAIQKARLDRVKERDVPAAIAATNPTWPESYNNAIPLIAPWVYDKKRLVIRKEDLSAAWKELCLQQ
ncbi:MAG: hypothetical protein ACI8R4_004067 [Paracoccaceae bacterium]|jgi:hypothetical protein